MHATQFVPSNEYVHHPEKLGFGNCIAADMLLYREYTCRLIECAGRQTQQLASAASEKFACATAVPQLIQPVVVVVLVASFGHKQAGCA